MYHTSYNSQLNDDAIRADAISVPPYPSRSDHPFAPPPPPRSINNSINSISPTSSLNQRQSAPHFTDNLISPTWQFEVSPPPPELEPAFHVPRQDSKLLSNLRHARVCPNQDLRLELPWLMSNRHIVRAGRPAIFREKPVRKETISPLQFQAGVEMIYLKMAI